MTTKKHKTEINNIKKIVNILSLLIVVSFISCSKDKDEVSIQEKGLTVTIDGETINFADNEKDVSFSDARLYGGKRLVISSHGDIVNLTLTIGEHFVNDPIKEGRYDIGGMQDNLETNIRYFDPNDTNPNNDSSTNNYTDVYGCDVLSNTLVGEINIIKLDTENKIVSGTFSGTLFRWVDVLNKESKTIELENGTFTLPYIEEDEDIKSDRNLISARVNGYRFMSEDPGSPDSWRSTSSGADKITIHGYDDNFGRMKIAILSNVESGKSYHYKGLSSLGVRFENRIDITEESLSNNPNQSNDAHIDIINHDTEKNSIEGTFYIENSKIEGRTITDGYFKIKYKDEVDE